MFLSILKTIEDLQRIGKGVTSMAMEKTEGAGKRASQLVADYLASRYHTLRIIKESPHGTISLVEDTMADQSHGRPIFVKKSIQDMGLPYKELQDIGCEVFPKVFYTAELPSAGTTIVIEEFIAGEPLSNRLEQKHYLTPQEATRLILTLCSGLTLLHQHGILHRDIKPSNIMEPPGASSSGLYRLIDFDAARIVKEGHEEDTRLLGTKGYAPPEQYGSAQTDARSDLYALGVTVRELLGPGYHGPLRPILAKCTEQDPARRYQSAAKLARAVRHAKLFYYGRRALILAGIAFCSLAAILLWHRFRYPEQPLPGHDELKNFSHEVKKAVKNEEQSLKNSVEQAKKQLDPPAKLPASSAPAKDSTATAPQAAPTSQAAPTATRSATTGEEAPAPNRVRVRLYCNGDRLNAWMDQWDTSISNGGAMQIVPAAVWQSGSLSAYSITARITNESDEIFASPILTVSDGSNQETTTAGAIVPGATAELTIPLGSFPTRGGGTHLTVTTTGMGPQVISTPTFALDFRAK